MILIEKIQELSFDTRLFIAWSNNNAAATLPMIDPFGWCKFMMTDDIVGSTYLIEKGKKRSLLMLPWLQILFP